jgi:hypothetical protein
VPTKQRHIIKILLVVPVYVIDAFVELYGVTLGEISLPVYTGLIRETYEAYCVYSFLALLLNALERVAAGRQQEHAAEQAANSDIFRRSMADGAALRREGSASAVAAGQAQLARGGSKLAAGPRQVSAAIMKAYHITDEVALLINLHARAHPAHFAHISVGACLADDWLGPDRAQPTGAFFVYKCYLGVVQYVIVILLGSFLTVVLEAAELLEEGTKWELRSRTTSEWTLSRSPFSV